MYLVGYFLIGIFPSQLNAKISLDYPYLCSLMDYGKNIRSICVLFSPYNLVFVLGWKIVECWELSILKDSLSRD